MSVFCILLVVWQSSLSDFRQSKSGRNLAGGSIEISEFGADVNSRDSWNYSVFTTQVQLGRSTISGDNTVRTELSRSSQRRDFVSGYYTLTHKSIIYNHPVIHCQSTCCNRAKLPKTLIQLENLRTTTVIGVMANMILGRPPVELSTVSLYITFVRYNIDDSHLPYYMKINLVHERLRVHALNYHDLYSTHTFLIRSIPAVTLKSQSIRPSVRIQPPKNGWRFSFNEIPYQYFY